MSRTLRSVLVGAIALVAAAAAAQEPPATRQTSPGGIAFRHIHMPGDTHQALFFGWPGGFISAEPGREAAAGFATRLILEGPKGVSRSQLIETFRDFQASANLFATSEHLRGNLVAPVRRFADAAALLGRTLANPAMSPDALKAMVASRVAELQQGRERPEPLAQRLLAMLLLPPGPWRNVAAPDPATVGTITLADAEAFRRDRLTRAGLEIVVAGPLTAEAAGPIVDTLFAALPASGRVRPGRPSGLRHPGRTIVLEQPVVQTIIIAGGPAPVGDIDGLVRAELAAAIVSGTRGRLFAELREKLGATYGVGGRLQPAGGWLRAYAVTTAVANDRAAAALGALRAEYARAVAGGVTAEEVDPLKTSVLTRHTERIRRSGGRASATLDAILSGLPDDYPLRLAGDLEKVGAPDVSATLAAAFPKSPLTIVVVAPSAEGLGADCVIKAAEEIARCE